MSFWVVVCAVAGTHRRSSVCRTSGPAVRAGSWPLAAPAHYRRGMVLAVAELLLLVLLAGLLLYALGVWSTRPALRTGSGSTRLPARARAEVAAPVGQARWTAAHDEVDGVTRILLRRSYWTGCRSSSRSGCSRRSRRPTPRGRRASSRRCRAPGPLRLPQRRGVAGERG